MVFLTACSSQADRVLTATEQDQVKGYSEPMVDNLIAAMKNNDYTAFSKDLDPTVKAIIGLTTFTDLLNKLNVKIGNCASRSISQMTESKGMFVVNYVLNCDNNLTIPMNVSFHTDAPHLIVAFSLHSQ
jgi:hypothetical protein